MGGFVFSLEQVLQYRCSRRDLCRQMLARILADQRALEERHRQLRQRHREQLAELKQLVQQGEVDINGSASRRYYTTRLTAEIAAVEENQAVVRQQMELCRQALVHADRDVKAMENLKERQRVEYEYQMEKRSALELEDTWSAGQIAGSLQ